MVARALAREEGLDMATSGSASAASGGGEDQKLSEFLSEVRSPPRHVCVCSFSVTSYYYTVCLLQVKAIEKRDSVLTSSQQIDRLLKPGSKYLNLNPYEVSPSLEHGKRDDE